MPKEKTSDTELPEVVVRPIFRPASKLIGVPYIQMVSPPGLKPMETVSPTRPAVDLEAALKVWLLSGPGGGGKTLAARWMMWRMGERGQSAMLTALDPTNRSLATWFDNVHQPRAMTAPTRRGSCGSSSSSLSRTLSTPSWTSALATPRCSVPSVMSAGSSLRWKRSSGWWRATS